jgi:hypothetical protein
VRQFDQLDFQAPSSPLGNIQPPAPDQRFEVPMLDDQKLISNPRQIGIWTQLGDQELGSVYETRLCIIGNTERNQLKHRR